MKLVRDPFQSSQRVKVGMIGLAAIILLIGLASAIMRTAAPAGTNASAQTIRNLAIANAAAAGEPLAELGAAPTNTQRPVKR